MIDATATQNVQGPLSIAGALVQTIDQEHETLVRLTTLFDEQLGALRKQALKQLEQSTVESHDLLAQLDRMRQTRTRQTRLLGRILNLADDGSLSALADALDARDGGADVASRLRAARQRLRTQAETTWQRCEELEYTLRYASDLGREMLAVIQDLNVPAPARVYTAAGTTAKGTSNQSFVNEVG